jgi:hypothetical protein
MLMGCVGRNCGSCAWWERQGPQLSKATRDPSAAADTGTCQVHAPVVVQGNSPFPVSMFPVTHETRSCGEWQGIGSDGPDGGETVVPFPTASTRIAA